MKKLIAILSIILILGGAACKHKNPVDKFNEDIAKIGVEGCSEFNKSMSEVDAKMTKLTDKYRVLKNKNNYDTLFSISTTEHFFIPNIRKSLKDKKEQIKIINLYKDSATIINNSTKPISLVKFQLTYYKRISLDGKLMYSVIKGYETYAINDNSGDGLSGDEVLLPGAKKTFNLYIPPCSSYDKVTIDLIHYW
ncbi:MAG TPA: hypothetical protein PKK00_01475 [Bacteroidales bacterium]|nr:hypothetical protein [Bacteroidales bacterium]HPS16124.1 hypothetical protein [Bacteroidales bacterium]